MLRKVVKLVVHTTLSLLKGYVVALGLWFVDPILIYIDFFGSCMYGALCSYEDVLCYPVNASTF